MTNSKWDENKLLVAVLKIKSIDEAKEFFTDLFTPHEMEEFSNRFLVAKMLSEGKSYIQIEKETGMSSTTIARISKCLKRERSGYQIILSRIFQ